jgi:predicted membrane protein
MDWLQSNWFMWVVIIIIAAYIFGMLAESFGEIGFSIKELTIFMLKVLLQVLLYVFLPVLIILNLMQEKKWEKGLHKTQNKQ